MYPFQPPSFHAVIIYDLLLLVSYYHCCFVSFILFVCCCCRCYLAITVAMFLPCLVPSLVTMCGVGSTWGMSFSYHTIIVIYDNTSPLIAGVLVVLLQLNWNLINKHKQGIYSTLLSLFLVFLIFVFLTLPRFDKFEHKNQNRKLIFPIRFVLHLSTMIQNHQLN